MLTAEAGLVLRLVAEWRPSTPVEQQPALDALRREFDAVLLAFGAVDTTAAKALGLKSAAHGLAVERDTFRTGLSNVFAAGSAIRARGMVVRSVADGREAAQSIHQYLSSLPVVGPKKPFSTRIGRLEGHELDQLVALAAPAVRQELPEHEYTLADAVQQASRCLHCDCRALSTCKLRRYAAAYGAEPTRFKGGRKVLYVDAHPSGVIYEPGKCIDCGLCIEIVTAAKEPLGLSFVGRGFDVRIGVPFNRTIEEALGKVAAECIAACPTAALSLRQTTPASELPILH